MFSPQIQHTEQNYITPVTIGAAELGVILGKATQTIYKDLGRNPAALPPPLRIPGSTRTRWLYEDVIDWLRQQRTAASQPQPQPPQPRRRGAPTKAERMARKEGGGA